MTIILPMIRRLILSATLAETAVVIARVYPSALISKKILSLLLWSGRDGRSIQLTKTRSLWCAVALIGSYLRLLCYRELGRHFTFELALLKNHRLVTTGPYSIVRHPSYTTGVLNNIAIIFIHGMRGSWVRESGLLNTIVGKVAGGGGMIGVSGRMLNEEEMLRKEFGSQWDEWAEKVPYKLIPGII
ncbi:hypothetical protein AMATHDRAFT_72002 [Amanita thiersii Skay4041]|uniref:Protein-S-isoprenylcysteine O-methyltransferase n=1 Tax=Amanita thiersii Skay4041 TaxID=703135 RepID=A0A2A9N810_9AGAR|nr:hypothetical protein AMATHDRAFT_72002 [Amanita thiersii Skay4041]